MKSDHSSCEGGSCSCGRMPVCRSVYTRWIGLWVTDVILSWHSSEAIHLFLDRVYCWPGAQRSACLCHNCTGTVNLLTMGIKRDPPPLRRLLSDTSVINTNTAENNRRSQSMRNAWFVIKIRTFCRIRPSPPPVVIYRFDPNKIKIRMCSFCSYREANAKIHLEAQRN